MKEKAKIISVYDVQMKDRKFCVPDTIDDKFKCCITVSDGIIERRLASYSIEDCMLIQNIASKIIFLVDNTNLDELEGIKVLTRRTNFVLLRYENLLIKYFDVIGCMKVQHDNDEKLKEEIYKFFTNYDNEDEEEFEDDYYEEEISRYEEIKDRIEFLKNKVIDNNSRVTSIMQENIKLLSTVAELELELEKLN